MSIGELTKYWLGHLVACGYKVDYDYVHRFVRLADQLSDKYPYSTNDIMSAFYDFLVKHEEIPTEKRLIEHLENLIGRNQI